jgi:hypothetical protein
MELEIDAISIYTLFCTQIGEEVYTLMYNLANNVMSVTTAVTFS